MHYQQVFCSALLEVQPASEIPKIIADTTVNFFENRILFFLSIWLGNTYLSYILGYPKTSINCSSE